MPTITIPDDPRLETIALSEGFANSAEYVRHLVETVVEQREPSAGPDATAWKERFHGFLDAMPERDAGAVDDSRESIYPVRP